MTAPAPGDGGAGSRWPATEVAVGTASCFTPWGVDLCALASAHGIDFHAAFVVSPDLGLGGDPLGVGSWWTPMVVWGTNRAGGLLPDFPIAYHDGYVTQLPDDPMRDFLRPAVRVCPVGERRRLLLPIPL